MSVIASILAARNRARQKGMYLGSTCRLPSSLFALAAEEYAGVNGGMVPTGSFMVGEITVQDAYDGN